MQKRIGLLWASMYDNMGDVAIGLMLQRVFDACDIPYHVVDPFMPVVEDTAALVIGGGELFRAPDHPFFDAYRVPGRHILNSVGVLSGEDTGYLREYRHVAVRSQSDKDLIGFGQVVPCPTLLYADYLPSGEPPITLPEGAIGVQVHTSSIKDTWQFIRWLRERQPGPVFFLPIMHYAHDTELMNIIARYVPGAQVLPVMSPDDVFRTIGQFRFLISSSLHATYFAYTQGVPFVAWTGPKKLRAFLSERELLACGFANEQELFVKFDAALAWDGFSPHQEQDRITCRDSVSAIVDHARQALAEDTAPITIQPASRDWHNQMLKQSVQRARRTLFIRRMRLAFRRILDLAP